MDTEFRAPLVAPRPRIQELPSGGGLKSREQVEAEERANPPVRKGPPPMDPSTAASQRFWRQLVVFIWLGRGALAFVPLALVMFFNLETIFLPGGLFLLFLSLFRRLAHRRVWLFAYGIWLLLLALLSYGISVGDLNPGWEGVFSLGTPLAIGSLIAAGLFSRTAYVVEEPWVLRINRFGNYHRHVTHGRVQLIPFVESIGGSLQVNRERTLYVPVNRGVMQPSMEDPTKRGLVELGMNVRVRYWIADDPQGIRAAFLNVDDLGGSMVKETELVVTGWMKAHKLYDIYAGRLELIQEEYGSRTPQVRGKREPAQVQPEALGEEGLGPEIEMQQMLQRRVAPWGVRLRPLGFSDILLPPVLASEFSKAQAAQVSKDAAETMSEAEERIGERNRIAVEQNYPTVAEAAAKGDTKAAMWIGDKAMELRKLQQAFGQMAGSGRLDTFNINELLRRIDSGETTEFPG